MALSGLTIGSDSQAQFSDTDSSAGLSIVATSPDSSSILASSPTDLFVSFDRAVDEFTLGNQDFQLVHLDADGSTRPLGIGEAMLSEAIDGSDPSGRRVDLSLVGSLLPGRYRLLLAPGAQIQGLDDSSLATQALPTDLSDFTIGLTTTGLAGAADLGTIGPVEAVRSDVLDLGVNPGLVQYYKFDVGPGHHWRVGVEISASRIGSPLASTLSLFDADGGLISTSSGGLSGDLTDPYLFAGLSPGTYYVGVSSRSNVPDRSGAYNPGQAILDGSQTGGPFQIRFVADAADQATRVLGVRVDRADPLSTNPTGLTLQFSGPIAIAGLQDPANPGLTLVDQDGKSWPITIVRYDANRGQLSLIFNQSLASGNYRIVESTTGGLDDLAGTQPVGTGLYPSTLGSFSFVRQGPIAGDLGPILAGVSATVPDATVEVKPGLTTTEQFVVLRSGVFDIRGSDGTNSANYSVRDARGNILASRLETSGVDTIEVSLQPGAYRIELTTTASGPSTVELSVRPKKGQGALLLDAGVAQGPALNLRLVTPQANFGQASGDPARSLDSEPTPGTPPVDPGRTSGAVGTVVAVGLSTPSGPSVAGSLYGTVPYGRPSPLSGQLSVVGPSTSSGSAALASASGGLPGGLMAIPVAIDGDGSLEPDAPPLDQEIRVGGPAAPRGAVTTEAGLLARSPGSRLQDDRALEEADWIGQLVSNATSWLESVRLDRAATLEDAPVLAPALSPQDRAPEADEPRLEAASLSSPIGVGVVLATIAYRYRRSILAKAKKGTKVGSPSGFKPILVGPHLRSGVRVR